MGIDCRFDWKYTFALNSPLTFTFTANSAIKPVDWQNGTYTIAFVGPQTFRRTNLKANGSGQVVALTPSVTGSYRYQRFFSATSSFSSESTGLSGTKILVSQNHQASVKLYTNPTTLKAGQDASLYIAVSGPAGLPTPGGEVSLHIGSSFTSPIKLGPGGSVLAKGSLPSPFTDSVIWVLYRGDSVYASSNVSFPLTNPPIPAGGSSTPQPITSTPGAVSTPANSATPTPTSGTANAPGGGSVTPEATATVWASSGVLANDASAPPSSGQSSALLWIALAAVALLVTGGVIGFIALRRRAAPTVIRSDQNGWLP